MRSVTCSMGDSLGGYSVGPDGDSYCGGPISGQTERYAFPGGGTLRDFAQALLFNAERDGMRSSAERFAIELQAAGSQVERYLIAGSSDAFLNDPNGEHFSAGVDLMLTRLEELQHELPLNEPGRSRVR